MFCVCVYLLPCKALRKEGQTPKNLITLVELLHIRRCYHGDAMVVHDTIVHTQTVAHCNTNHTDKNPILTNSS